MATFLDVSLLGSFTSIFTFLLVFAVIFGMLEMLNILGEGRRGLRALIALVAGFLVILNSGVIRVVQTFTPWFTVMIIIFFFIIFALRVFGVSPDAITFDFYTDGSISTWIIILSLIILLFALAAGFGQQTLESTAGSNVTQTTANTTVTMVNGQPVAVASTGTTNFNQNLFNTLFHPKILGLALVMLIVILAVVFFTSREGP